MTWPRIPCHAWVLHPCQGTQTTGVNHQVGSSPIRVERNKESLAFAESQIITYHIAAYRGIIFNEFQHRSSNFDFRSLLLAIPLSFARLFICFIPFSGLNLSRKCYCLSVSVSECFGYVCQNNKNFLRKA